MTRARANVAAGPRAGSGSDTVEGAGALESSRSCGAHGARGDAQPVANCARLCSMSAPVVYFVFFLQPPPMDRRGPSWVLLTPIDTLANFITGVKEPVGIEDRLRASNTPSRVCLLARAVDQSYLGAGENFPSRL